MIAQQLKKYLTDFFKGKEIEEVVIDKLKEKHDIAFLTEEIVEPKKAAVSPKKVNTVTQEKSKKTKFLLNLNQQKPRKKKCVQI